MFSITIRRSVTTLAVMAGLLAAAGPAGASSTGNDRARAVGLKGDSNEVAVEGFMDYTDDALVFSGDAYDNEMGVRDASDHGPAHRQTKVDAAPWLPEVDDEVLMADMGGQFYSRTQPSANGIIAILIGL